MSDSNDKVIATKTALVAALADKTQSYFDNLRMWFRHKWTKEEFDMQSRPLLTPEKIHLHNEFFKAILNKIETIQTSQAHYQQSVTTTPSFATSSSSSNRNSRKRKRSSRTTADRVNFEVFDVLDYVTEDNLDVVARPPNVLDDASQTTPAQRCCVQELFLPDLGFIMGRLLVCAWEDGLVNVDDGAAEYVATAVQVLLKNIITEIILKRKHYKVTGEGSYFYDVGAPIKDPFLKNTVSRQKIDDGPMELDKEITSPNVMRRGNDETVFLSACEEPVPQKRQPINLWDVYNALQNRNIIPSHTLYAINMERLTQLLH